MIVCMKPNISGPGHFLEDQLARNWAVDYGSTEGSMSRTGSDVKPLHFTAACGKHHLLESNEVRVFPLKRIFPRPLKVTICKACQSRHILHN